MFKSIVVGTNGTETADIALSRAVELAQLTGATLHVVSAYEPAPAHVGGSRPPAEAAEWAISPHFKVDAVLDRATDLAKGGGIEIEVARPQGDAGIGDPDRGRGARRRPDRARQQGHAGRAPRARQRAEQGVAPGGLRRADRPDDSMTAGGSRPGPP